VRDKHRSKGLTQGVHKGMLDMEGCKGECQQGYTRVEKQGKGLNEG